MTPTQARKKRAKLNVKIKAGNATSTEKAEFARLVAMKAKPGRPRKAAKAPPPMSPTETTPAPATPPPLPVDVPILEGAAPGLDFSVPGFASADDEAAKAPKADPAKPDAPIVPSSAAIAMADKVVGALAYTSTFMAELYKFDPLMGMGEIVYPALRAAWAQVLEETGIASKADAFMNNRTAARVAVVSSACYLGGGGLYAMAMLKKRAQDATVESAPPPPSTADAKAAEPTPAAPRDHFAEATAPEPPPPIVARPVRDYPVSQTGVVQMIPSFSAESKS